MPGKPIAIFGAGAWGTALGIHLATCGHRVLMWSNEPRVLAGMALAKCNERYLSGIPFPPNLKVTSDLNEIAQIPNWLLVVPSHAFSDVLLQAWQYNSTPRHIAWATKGLCSTNGTLLHEAARTVVGDNYPLTILSGPSFAREVATGMPTAVTVASTKSAAADFWTGCLSNNTFQCYTTTDLVGVQIGGAVKNILAIMAGLSDGLGYGTNARCAIIARGLAEMSALASKLGADPHTLMGLSGIGDLVLTCTDNQSRNRSFGVALGQGQSVDEVMVSIGHVIEGITTAGEVGRLAASVGVEMPITQHLNAILAGEMRADDAINSLFSGPSVAE